MLPLTAAFETVAQMFSTNTFNEQEAKVRKVPPGAPSGTTHAFVRQAASSPPIGGGVGGGPLEEGVGLLSPDRPLSLPQRTLVGLVRDLRGIAFAFNAKTSFMMLFEWMYPSSPLGHPTPP